MSAFIKVYTDSGHSSEVAHTTDHSSTITTGHGATSGDQVLYVTSLSGMPDQGTFDITDGTNTDTVNYYGDGTSPVNLAQPLAHDYAAGSTVTQWYYELDVGDQTNGISNDGTNASPNSPTNVGTWYLYNEGDQTAQGLIVATDNSAPSTTSGFADTLVSKTSASASFATSQTIGDVAAGAAATQIWVAAEIPSGQSAAGNPQKCVINLTYSSI